MQSLREQVTILAGLQGLDGGSQHLDSVTVEDAHLVHLHTNVQTGLSTEGEEDAVRPFPLNDVRHIFGRDGEVVDLIGQEVRRLDGRDIGVDKDRLLAGLLESLDSLRAYPPAAPSPSAIEPSSQGEFESLAYQSSQTLPPVRYSDHHCQ